MSLNDTDMGAKESFKATIRDQSYLRGPILGKINIVMNIGVILAALGLITGIYQMYGPLYAFGGFVGLQIVSFAIYKIAPSVTFSIETEQKPAPINSIIEYTIHPEEDEVTIQTPENSNYKVLLTFDGETNVFDLATDERRIIESGLECTVSLDTDSITVTKPDETVSFEKDEFDTSQVSTDTLQLYYYTQTKQNVVKDPIEVPLLSKEGDTQ